MAAESLRQEQARLIGEIAERAERLRHVTELIDARWHQPPDAQVLSVPTVLVRHAPSQAGNVNAEGRRTVTQK